MLNNEQKIKKIGEKLVKCNFQCGGIVNDPKKGVSSFKYIIYS